MITPEAVSIVIPLTPPESVKEYGAVPRVAFNGAKLRVFPAVVQKLQAENLLFTGVITTARCSYTTIVVVA